MTREKLLSDIVKRVNMHLDVMEATGTPGSVVVEIHKDAIRVKTVKVRAEEAWQIPPDA